MDLVDVNQRRFTRRLAARFFVRWHMVLIFVAVCATATVASSLWLDAGVRSLALRYGLVALSAYAVFFVLVRMWIFYVTHPSHATTTADSIDVSLPFHGAGGGPGGGPAVQPGGGSFGGGGASGAFDGPVMPSIDGGAEAVGDGSVDAGWSLDFDDAVVLIVAVVVVVACLAGVAAWLVWQAPVILPEAAFDALVGSAVTGAAGRAAWRRQWAPVVFRATGLPFAMVLAAVVVLGWAVQHLCPGVVRVIDAVSTYDP